MNLPCQTWDPLPSHPHGLPGQQRVDHLGSLKHSVGEKHLADIQEDKTREYKQARAYLHSQTKGRHSA